MTTEVVDAVHGVPAARMLIDLFRLAGGIGERQHVRTIETNEEGRTSGPLVAGDAFLPATYELLFHVGRYFKSTGTPPDDTAFLDVVPVRFAIANASRNYRIALVASRNSYTVFSIADATAP